MLFIYFHTYIYTATSASVSMQKDYFCPYNDAVEDPDTPSTLTHVPGLIVAQLFCACYCKQNNYSTSKMINSTN